MKSEISISKKMADTIVQVCFDVVEFSRLYEQDHPNSAKNLFYCNEAVKKGLKWFINAQNKAEFQNKVSDYLSEVTLAKKLYQDIQVPVESKDNIIAQLTKIQTHLNELKEGASTHQNNQ
ncbi:hypothetical protein [Mesonia aestuariivivens]|uniref:Four helix bundle protein n=1 Tax=Mesonia aestuariivivens TaxID=2796128 RepID=A0ABS6VZS3_9FLAO|nr:hypothetical protein [Mesonia aestuariivivens]MBW2961100.1 hypothetical protein [Mesonia aestuariivivens]